MKTLGLRSKNQLSQLMNIVTIFIGYGPCGISPNGIKSIDGNIEVMLYVCYGPSENLAKLLNG